MALQENYHSCRLYQIPDELILGISEFLEGSDVYVLRQTSLKFRRIFSGRKFVKSVACSTKGSHIPNLPTDWGDVSERLRQMHCCLSCTDVRITTSPGVQSTYDKVMSRMVNSVKWCHSCRASHPLIMFPPSQRGFLNGGARCVLSQGSITVCPHFALSIKSLGGWMNSVRPGSRAKVFACDKCITSIGTSKPPSVT